MKLQDYIIQLSKLAEQYPDLTVVLCKTSDKAARQCHKASDLNYTLGTFYPEHGEYPLYGHFTCYDDFDNLNAICLNWHSL